MSPTRSSAGGLKARTRATRFAGSSSSTPGVAANTRPFRSYVPSPGSNSSATAISSPGRTILRSIGIRSTYWVRPKDEPAYLSLRYGDPKQYDVDAARLVPVELECARNRECVWETIRDCRTRGFEVPPDERLGGRIQEGVHDVAAPQGRIEERAVRVPRLRTERRIHQDGVDLFANPRDVVEPPFGFDADRCGVLF